MKRVIIIYLTLSVFFLIFFAFLDGWAGVRAHLTSVVLVAAAALLGVGFVWLGKKLGIRIND